MEDIDQFTSALAFNNDHKIYYHMDVTLCPGQLFILFACLLIVFMSQMLNGVSDVGVGFSYCLIFTKITISL